MASAFRLPFFLRGQGVLHGTERTPTANFSQVLFMAVTPSLDIQKIEIAADGLRLRSHPKRVGDKHAVVRLGVVEILAQNLAASVVDGRGDNQRIPVAS